MTTRPEDWAGSDPEIVFVDPAVEQSLRVKLFATKAGPLDPEILALFENLGWEEERTLL